MNKNQWFACYRDLPGLLVTATEVADALADAPEDMADSIAEDLDACRAAQAAGAVVAWWRRAHAGGTVPATWDDAAGTGWSRDDDGLLCPPEHVDVGRGIFTPDELHAWLQEYERVTAMPA